MSHGPIISTDKLPWGWHFRPTGAELIHSLKKKVRRQRQERRSFEPEEISEVLREIDLSQYEPWEIKEIPETCSIRAAHADDNQYFYTQKEQKYRHGKRSNRATRRGFWKATGRDKPIYGRLNAKDRHKRVIGYRKALVFYEGRAPNGNKTDWILHEYRLENGPDATSRDSEQSWVACHMFIKERNIPGPQTRETQETAAVDVEPDSVQEHHTEWTDLQHGQSVKPEPGLPYSSVYPSVTVTSLVSTRNSAPEPQLQYARPGVMVDDLSLPRLVSEEITYPVHSMRPVEGVLPRPTTARLPSFDNDRIISDLLFGIYAEQHPPSQHQQYISDDRLWLP